MRWTTLLVLVAASSVFAQSEYPRDVAYCWTNPTQYEDLTPIEPGDLRGTIIQVRRNDGTVVIEQEIPIGTALPGSRQCYTFVNMIPQPGTYSAFAYAVTVQLTMSGPSNESIKKFIGKPQPPTVLE